MIYEAAFVASYRHWPIINVKQTLQPIKESTLQTLSDASVKLSCYMHLFIKKMATFDPWSTNGNKLGKCHVTS